MPIPQPARRLTPGTLVPPRTLVSITGDPVPIPDPAHLVHLQFSRFAGCPVCNLHLRSFVRRHDEIAAAGIREVVLFHSTRDALLPHAADLPFAVVADPDKRLYAEFGVESASRALLSPRAWLPILSAILLSAGQVARRRHPLPPLNPAGGRLGLPADFLLAPAGHLLASHYATHAYDQWSVDQLLTLLHEHSEHSPQFPLGKQPASSRNYPPRIATSS